MLSSLCLCVARALSGLNLHFARVRTRKARCSSSLTLSCWLKLRFRCCNNRATSEAAKSELSFTSSSTHFFSFFLSLFFLHSPRAFFLLPILLIVERALKVECKANKAQTYHLLSYRVCLEKKEESATFAAAAALSVLLLLLIPA